MKSGQSVQRAPAPDRTREKYRSEVGYRLTQGRRLLIRAAIRRLVSWEPLEDPAPGYTIVIGCNVPLARMLACNLKFLARQDLRNVDRVLVVLDRPRAQMVDDVEPWLRDRFPSLPLEFEYYSTTQRRVCDLVAWPWVQSWLSWSMGISRARTRYALLHDFDAMLLRPDIVEERYRVIAERGHEYVGARFYDGNGVVVEDGLAATFELMFDLQHVRRVHRPVDLFNQVTRHRGRRVDFDTFLFAQTLAGTSSALPIAEEDMVHPSQLICHFEDLRLGRRAVPAANGLPLIPYFLFAGDEQEMMRSMTEQLEGGTGPSVDFMGKPLDLAGLPPASIRWLAKQAYRLEAALAGQARPEVRRYFDALDAFVSRASGNPLALLPA